MGFVWCRYNNRFHASIWLNHFIFQMQLSNILPPVTFSKNELKAMHPHPSPPIKALTVIRSGNPFARPVSALTIQLSVA